MKIRHLITCLLLTHFLGSPLIAQQDTEASGPRTLFRTLGWNVGEADLYYRSGGELVSLSLRNSSLSGYHEYRGSSQLKVFILDKDPSTGDDNYKPFANINLLSGKPIQLLVFNRSSNKNSPVRVLAYDDSLDVTGEKDLFVGNFSRIPLAFEINDEERFGLKSGESRVIENKGNHHAQIQLATFREDKWELEYRSKSRLRKGYRMYFFFTDQTGHSSGSTGIAPISLNENIFSVEKALTDPDAEDPTGSVKGETIEVEDF